MRTVTAHSQAGERLRRVHPHLASYGNMVLQDTTPEALAGHDVVIFALPHGASGALAAAMGDDTLLVDCGADHRLESANDWNDYYGGEWAGAWTYGMPELPRVEGPSQRERLAGARTIAVPGCNVTVLTFAFAPLVADHLVTPSSLSAVLAVGPSGAGKKPTPTNVAAELIGQAVPYSPDGSHSHNPEVQQNLRNASGQSVQLTFAPVLVPMARGILATAHAQVNPGVTRAMLRASFERHLDGEPFVGLLPEGEWPRTGDVLGSNRVAIGVGLDERAGQAVIVTAIDNLGKGTAGAAIQNINLALGLDECLGLSINGVAP